MSETNYLKSALLTPKVNTHCSWCHWDLWSDEETKEGIHPECKTERDEWYAEKRFGQED